MGQHVKEHSTFWKQKSFCLARMCVIRRATLGNTDEVVGRDQMMQDMTDLLKEFEFYPGGCEESWWVFTC